MASATISVVGHQPGQHGPVANAVKWAFKRYIQARRLIDEAVAEARDDRLGAAGDRTPGQAEPAMVAGGSDADVSDLASPTTAEPDASPASEGAVRSISDAGARVFWISSGGIEQHDASALDTLLQRDDGFVWVDILTFDPSAECLLTDIFKFHPLAVRDCREPGQVPKVHAYADHLFLVLHAPETGRDGDLFHRELDQFIGPRYLVTVHERPDEFADSGSLPETSAVLDRMMAGRARPASPAELSYAIVTRLAARMESLVSDLAITAAALDRRVVKSPGGAPESVVDEMYELRHALLAVETITDQNRVVYARADALTDRHGLPEQGPFIEDLRDQFGRVRRLCQGQREILQGALDFSRTRSTAKMDRAMSRLALLSAVALPISIISSIYGMNLIVFNQTHPEVLAAVLAAMAVMTLAMLRWAKQQGWR